MLNDGGWWFFQGWTMAANFDAEHSYHYPTELLSLLIDCIPLLCRYKTDVVQFFRAAGVDRTLLEPWAERLRIERSAHNKYAIVRDILTKLNEKETDDALRQRREVLRRVVEWENFSTLWPDDQLKAKGLVADVRKLVNVKDSFTRMKQAREDEEYLRRAPARREQEARQTKKAERECIRKELAALFLENNHQKRGRALESLLNRLFAAYDILVRESFKLRGEEGEGIVCQIDGVIELDGHLYLVEMKWLTNHVGVGDVSHHVTRVLYRGGGVRGLFISASEYTPAALHSLRQALLHQVHFACLLREFVFALEVDADIRQMLREKVQHAAIDQTPLHVVGFFHS